MKDIFGCTIGQGDFVVLPSNGRLLIGVILQTKKERHHDYIICATVARSGNGFIKGMQKRHIHTPEEHSMKILESDVEEEAYQLLGAAYRKHLLKLGRLV